MKTYETSEFRIDDSGVVLLRGRFPYKRFSIQEISEFEVRKGNVVNNHMAVLVMGITLIAAGLYIGDLFGSVTLSVNQLGLKAGKVLGYLIMMVTGLICFGGILIYQATKKDFVLVIKTATFKKSFPLTALRKSKELDSFLTELKALAGAKLTTFSRELILK